MYEVIRKHFSSAEVFPIRITFGKTDICLENEKWQISHGHLDSHV